MPPEHWLSYSHSDQALFRDPELERVASGLVVPGTLATFYFEGTGGFVLAQREPYVLDPRTPLLQPIRLKRPIPRASHLKLLEMHDPDPVGWWPGAEIEIEHWQDGRWPEVVRSVLNFQQMYAVDATKKLSKYERLKAEARGEEHELGDGTTPPVALVPPYWAVEGRNDPWWALSLKAAEIAVEQVGYEVRPILTLNQSADIATFAELVAELPASVTNVFCWRGSWNEAEATDEDVRGWVKAVGAAGQRGMALTNLYGGYLSVLLTELGLAGLSHGVGYSESRDVRRLGETGAPPIRYYVPAVHAFLPVPSAQPLLDHLPAEWSCACDVCKEVTERGRPVVSRLTPFQRKKHFLLARQTEIQDLSNRGIQAVVDEMGEIAEWLERHPLSDAGTPHFRQVLTNWSGAIEKQLG